MGVAEDLYYNWVLTMTGPRRPGDFPGKDKKKERKMTRSYLFVIRWNTVVTANDICVVLFIL